MCVSLSLLLWALLHTWPKESHVRSDWLHCFHAHVHTQTHTHINSHRIQVMFEEESALINTFLLGCRTTMAACAMFTVHLFWHSLNRKMCEIRSFIRTRNNKTTTCELASLFDCFSHLIHFLTTHTRHFLSLPVTCTHIKPVASLNHVSLSFTLTSFFAYNCISCRICVELCISYVCCLRQSNNREYIKGERKRERILNA